MILAIFPTRESGPLVLRILFNNINDEEEDTGRRKANGRISLGMKLILMRDIKSFRRLLLVNMEMEIIMANILGNIVKAISNPSVTIMPTTIISLRMMYGSLNPEKIIPYIIITSSLSCLVGLILDRIFYMVMKR